MAATPPLVTATEAVKDSAAIVAAMRDTVDGLIISNDDDQASAGDIVKDLRRARAKLEDKRTAITGPLNESLKQVNGLFRPPRDQIDEILSALKKKMDNYAALQAQIAADEARQAREEAARQEAEARKAAEELEAAGATETAEAVVEAAEGAVEKAAKEPKPQISRGEKASTSVVTRWVAEITDIREFLHAVADGEYPIVCIGEIKMGAMHQKARAEKVEKTHRGVRFKKQVTAAAR